MRPSLLEQSSSDHEKVFPVGDPNWLPTKVQTIDSLHMEAPEGTSELAQAEAVCDLNVQPTQTATPRILTRGSPLGGRH